MLITAQNKESKADSSTTWLYLSEASRKNYHSHEFDSLKNPTKEMRTEKIKTVVTFHGFAEKPASSFFLSEYPRDRYEYLKPHDEELPYTSEDFPVIFSKRSRKRLLERMDKLEEGTDITLYGIVKKAKSRRSSSSTKERFCFMVVDAYLGVIESQQFVEEAEEIERVVEVETRFINLKLKRLINRTVSFTATFASRKSEIDWLSSESSAFLTYSSRKFIQFVCSDKSLTDCKLLIPRELEDNLRELYDLIPGDRVEITAKVKLLTPKTSTQAARYVLVVDDLDKSVSTGSPNNVPESNEEKWSY